MEPLEIYQEFAVPVDRLYAAWTEEEQLRKWWKPMEDSLLSVAAELKDDGEVNYTFAGGKFSIKGKYEKVDPGKRLIYSWNWSFAAAEVMSENFTLDVRFEGIGNRSKLQVIQTGFRGEEEKNAHQGGWAIGLRQLEDHLKSN